jgi:zinc protease
MLDRKTAPAADKISQPNFPTSESLFTSNGIEIITLRQASQPVIMVDIVLETGRWQESTPGITYFVSKMLLEGTAKKSSAEIADELDFHGSHMEITPTLDYVYIKLYCLKKFFENQISLLFHLLTESNFPKKEFEKLKTIRIQQIRQQHVKTNAYCGLKFRESIYGSAHPYGQIIGEAEVTQTRVEDVKFFYENSFFISPKVFLAGAVDDNEINLIAEKLKTINIKLPKAAGSILSVKSNDVAIDWENSVQSSIRLGGHTIGKSHKDIHNLKITNELLGGFFGSRLMKNIREEKGLTYGISSSLTHMDKGSYWVIGTDVLKEKSRLAIDEIKKEIIRLQNEAPSQEELEVLKSYIQGKWLMSFDSCFNSMQLIMSNHLSGLNHQYWYDFIHALDACTPEIISATATKYFKLNESTETIVG